MTHLFRATWPIVDLDLTLGDLIREAEPQVSDLLHATRAILTGPLSWRVTEAWKAGCPPHHAPQDELVLELTAPAQPWNNPRLPRRSAH